MVDRVLAFCYASFDHDMAHFAMKPVQRFQGIIEWIFGWNNGSQVYNNIVKSVGRFLMPDNNLYTVFKN